MTRSARGLPGGALTIAVLAALIAIGAAIRLVMLQDSLFGDELSTYWIVTTNGLGGVIDTVHTDAEITPPLYFVLAWLTTRIDLTAEMLRLPSFIAGVVAIPLTYLLGLRTVGRWAGMAAAAFTALSPFLIYYSTEARGYEIMIALVLGSTLALLAALDTGRARWWVAYGACSCAAMYSHYTAAYALAAQLVWVLWAHPEARRPALLANVGAAIGFAPWFSGLIADLNSPTTAILGALQPFNLATVRTSLGHWSVGYPYAFPTTGIGALPGTVALVVLALGVAAALLGLALGRARAGRWPRIANPRGLVLIGALALAAPVGLAVTSIAGNDVFGARNLAVSWPAFAVALAALLTAAQRPFRIAAIALALAAFGIGGAKMLESHFQRPDYAAVASQIDRTASPSDAVVDAGAVSPGPLTTLDIYLQRESPPLRAGMPQESDHPFTIADPVAPPATVGRQAVAAAHGGPIYLVSQRNGLVLPGHPTSEQLARGVTSAFPADYRQRRSWRYPGIVDLVVQEFGRTGGTAG